VQAKEVLLTPVLTVTRSGKRKKVKHHASALNYPSTAKTETAGYVGEKEDGTRFMAVLSTPAGLNFGPRTFAIDVCQTMAKPAIPDTKTQLTPFQEKMKQNEQVRDYAYLQISRIPGGKFKVKGVVGSSTTVIAFDPNSAETISVNPTYGFRTLGVPQASDSHSSPSSHINATNEIQANEIHEILPEDSIVLCLTGDILAYLAPKKQEVNPNTESGGQNLPEVYEIDFPKLFAEGFKLPANLNESTLINAFANYAAKKSKAQGKTPSGFFVIGLCLSNELKTNPWLNPANWATPLLILALGIVFGLKLFAAPAVFSAAAPILMPLVFSLSIIAGAMLVIYMAHNLIKDWRNQRKNQRLVDSNLNQTDTPEDSFAQRYMTDGSARIWTWLTKQHPYQLYFGIFITLVMITLASVALASILNPAGLDATVAGHALLTIFNFIAQTLSQLSHGTFLQFEVGSITSDVAVILTSALLPTFFLNAIRQLCTTGYEKFKDESLSDVESVIKVPEEVITHQNSTRQDTSETKHTSNLSTENPEEVITHQNSTRQDTSETKHTSNLSTENAEEKRKSKKTSSSSSSADDTANNTEDNPPIKEKKSKSASSSSSTEFGSLSDDETFDPDDFLSGAENKKIHIEGYAVTKENWEYKTRNTHACEKLTTSYILEITNVNLDFESNYFFYANVINPDNGIQIAADIECTADMLDGNLEAWVIESGIDPEYLIISKEEPLDNSNAKKLPSWEDCGPNENVNSRPVFTPKLREEANSNSIKPDSNTSNTRFKTLG
jgi:hypothetical protein